MAPRRDLAHKPVMSRYLILAARTLALLTIAAPLLLSLDLFSSGASAADIAIGMMIQLTPSVILLALLSVAWQQPVIGGMMFVLVSGIPLFFLPMGWPTNVITAAPLLAAGGLFIAGGVKAG